MSLIEKVATYAAEVPDWEIAAELNAPDESLPKKRVDVPVYEIRSILLTSGAWPKIIMSAEDTLTPINLRGLCITVRDAMAYLTEFRMSDPTIYATVSTMVDGLFAATFITQETKDKLMALAEAPQSWADVHNAGVPLMARDVGLARGAKP